MTLIKCIFLCFFFIFYVIADDQPIVKIQNGLVKGYYRNTRKNRQFVAFEGIPYAKPPLGDLRFRAPEPHEPWLGIWDANTAYTCIQIDHGPFDVPPVIGDEDCLYLNVYTPRLNDESSNLDVIVHIHGGAFMFGQGSFYGPDLLLDRDVVYVTMNYRLGALGFLSTEDNVSPGNYGLKDQVLALQWIQDNIKAFGGNKDAVTITGLSAGGASVHFHYLSQLSRGLFARGFSISGTALCNWALVEKPLEKARKLGTVLGCTQKSVFDLVACLRQRPAQQIANAGKELQVWLYNPYSPFGPVIEPSSKDAFLSSSPYELLRLGQVADVPWITSVTTEEGLYPAATFVYNSERLNYLDKYWEQVAPYIMHYQDTVPKNKMNSTSQKIREHYLKDRPITEDSFSELVQAIGDRLFVVDAEKAARLQAQVNKSPVYFYVFAYRGGHSITEKYAKKMDDFGVAHADDVLYAVSADPTWFANYLQTEDDKKMSSIYIDMWISFAKTGKPKLKNVTWKPLSKDSDDLSFLLIKSPEKMVMKKEKELGHRSFWDSLPFLENDLLDKNSNKKVEL